MCQSGSGDSGTPDAGMLTRILRLQRLPVTCASCGLHSARPRVVRDYLESRLGLGYVRSIEKGVLGEDAS
jgi:hypothetical protein